MDTVQARMTNLFLQLGLDASPEGIERFIAGHFLPAEMNILEAPFWSDPQRQLLRELLNNDAEWAVVVDQLNESLHEEDA
ncbi:hypothetical protein A6D6_01165 [Alcanivorax xiamenensis]|uniref:DUF2789 domain-containing protein n=1 Tax=Alcanivorax xiamenensis TaxID=1177156 RepID=A0ABQ6YB55_9GAMM|nr:MULTISPECIES: DUF2789 domain-containing protein [Alcanivorax]KAF0807166.1 hypothetical protein A6D6_01165 [Alcanivorax xiamenensis]